MGKVSLFIPCTVDMLLADIGKAAVKLLRTVGQEPVYHPEQTCCGHPAITAGHDELAVDLAKRFINIFENDQYIVCLAGSCVYTVKHYYPKILADDPLWQKRAVDVGSRLYEFSQYMVDILGVEDVGAKYQGKIAYHESCSLLRHLGIGDQPKKLIQNVREAELVALNAADACCGFGGEFSYKYGEISAAIVEEKVNSFIDSGADILLISDPGCLLNISGYLSRHNPGKKAMHLASFLGEYTKGVRA